MTRPFFAHSIDALESEFEERQGEAAFLIALADELTHRTSLRAKQLATKVREDQSRLPSKTPPATLMPAPHPGPPPEPSSTFNAPPVDAAMPLVSNDPIQILGAWTALEVLSPQTFDHPKKLAGGDGQAVAHIEDGPLPWEVGEMSRPNKKLFYHLILGTLNAEQSFHALLQRFSDTRAERATVRGETAIAMIVLDKTGRLAGKSAVAVSSFAWGLPVALRGDLTALADWPAAASVLEKELNDRLRRADGDGQEQELNHAIIAQTFAWLTETLNLDPALVRGPRYVIRAYEYFRSPEPPAPLLLNSFYLGDLARTRTLFENGKGTRSLKLFLGADSPAPRRDLFHDQLAVEDAVAPSSIPLARWPGEGRHPLVLLQQAAVNLALRELRDGGIVGVNGPPGTGKTTLLRDIVAAQVAERAEAMCRFDDPASAFTHSGHRIKAGQAWLHLYSVTHSLRGYEMLVASSNNKAVENVSAELPGASAVAEDAGLNYFRPLSDVLLDRPTWGLVAAVLGNARNRGAFHKTFWWDKEVGLASYLAEAAGTPQWIDDAPGADGTPPRHRPRLVVEANAPQGHAEAIERWKKVRASFEKQLTKNRAAFAALETVREQNRALPGLAAADTHAHAVHHAAAATERTARTARDSARTALDATEVLHLKNDQKLIECDVRKPSFLALLFRTQRWRVWSDARQPLLAAQKASAAARAAKTEELKRCVREWQLAESVAKSRFDEADAARVHHENVKREVGLARGRVGERFIDDAFFQLTHEKRHQVVPWGDAAVHRMRDDLFSAAMEVHKAFIDAAAKPIKHNLGALMNAMGATGGPLTGPKALLLPDVWATLFLVVPVVSTTFASVERMMGALPPESLGWLLIDEAGQALPQAAVGALMRTRRAVVVGDPIQIEPVVPLPDSLTETICRRFGVDPDHYNAPTASAQTLADAATPYLAEFQGPGGSRTVGVPLLVHRRCAEPMFGIANAVAYERMMVQAKAPRLSAIVSCLGPSAWIHVEGQAREKWCPEEGEVVLDLLRKLKAADVPPNLYIVSPFVVVVENLRRLIMASGVLATVTDKPFAWTNERIGTVHTVQGREAEAVVLVLGAPDPQQRGARVWAGKRPNLLNVALTRAQEAIYVVGNRKLWAEAGVFRQLDEGLR